MDPKLPSTKILGTNITTVPKADILEFIFKGLHYKRQKFYIVTPNPEILVGASRSKDYQDILNHALVSLPDGVGVVQAGSILKKGVKGRITGVDLMQDICKESVRQGFTVGLFGGAKGVAEQASKCLREKYPSLVVKVATDSWEGNYGHIDMLFVGLGAPKQEVWIAKNLPTIDVTCAMGVGGAFDYISGKIPRAPKMIRTIGMEWAFRLVIQPWRIKRQLALPVFVGKVLKEKFLAS